MASIAIHNAMCVRMFGMDADALIDVAMFRVQRGIISVAEAAVMLALSGMSLDMALWKLCRSEERDDAYFVGLWKQRPFQQRWTEYLDASGDRMQAAADVHVEAQYEATSAKTFLETWYECAEAAMLSSFVRRLHEND